MTNNDYWIYLEKLRRSGETNMYGARPYLEREFDLDPYVARLILADWMKNYKDSDYVGLVEDEE